MTNDFEIENGVLIKYHGTDAHVVIPDGVTEIGSYALSDTFTMLSVEIPQSMIIIGEGAFWNCKQLTTLTIPNSVRKIGQNAFQDCKRLISLTITNEDSVIERKAFFDCTSLTSITIPDSVKKIGYEAFKNCIGLADKNGFVIVNGILFSYHGKDSKISIPDSVIVIGSYAIENSQITSVTIPTSVKRILGLAFCFCSSLSAVFMPESVTEIERNDIFDRCKILTVICREGSYAHQFCEQERIRFIFDYQYEAFHGVIPKGVEQLSSPFLADEEKPFIFISYSHKDRDIILPVIKTLYESGWKIWYDEGLTIGDKYDETLEEHVRNCSAFLLFVTENSLDSMYVRENEIPWAIKFGKPIIKCILNKEIDYEMSEDAVLATVSTADIEPALERVSNLSKGERREAKGISVVVDPANRASANGDGYAYCLYTEENAVTAKAILLEAANNGCTLYDATKNEEDSEKLQNAACLIVFLDKAFLKDDHLTSLLTAEFRSGKDIAVCLLEDIEDNDLPEELIALHSMQWLNFVHGITGDMNMKLARHLQKRGCRNTAVLPGFEYEETSRGIEIKRYKGMDPNPRIESEYGGIPVIKIGTDAFKNCVYLKTLVIPDGITEIGAAAFDGCTGLTSVSIPDSVTAIHNLAFRNCTGLTSLSIPESVIIIGNNAFEGCAGLTAIRIPKNITRIKAQTFAFCKNLTDISIPNSVTTIDGWAFCYCPSLTNIVVPSGLTVIEDGLFSDCTKLTSVTIPNNVSTIGDGAFSYCKALTSITIPYSVKEIQKRAFLGCKSLTTVIITNNATVIKDRAFESCGNVTVKCSPESIAWKYCGNKGIPVKPIDDNQSRSPVKSTETPSKPNESHQSNSVLKPKSTPVRPPEIKQDKPSATDIDTLIKKPKPDQTEKPRPSLFRRLFGKK